MKRPSRRTRDLGTGLLYLVVALVGAPGAASVQGIDETTLLTSPFYLGRHDVSQANGAVLRTTAATAGQDWAASIDAAWGPSPLPPADRRQLFESVWNAIDEEFACFQGLTVDWDAVHALYDFEIEQPDLSRGRFDAIMNHMTLALRESHTRADDGGVSGTPLAPGVPLFVVGGWGENGHFGAGLTPLPDGTLLVYDAVDPHPLGLVPGDIVLGYDGAPWSDLYPQLLAAELPLTGWWAGSSPSSYTHSMSMSAGMNWHLFNIIDVVKFDTGNVEHFALDPMVGASMSIFCTEQLDISGVPKPDIANQHVVSWGTLDVEEGPIGYIYVWAWTWNAEQEFLMAVEELLDSTIGLIIDFRTNYGGNMFLSDAGLEVLFGEDVETIGFAERCDPDDHSAMCQSPGGLPEFYVIHGDPATSYDRPIAVLVGPGALSAGDQVALRMAYHPRARLFGKSTATAFNSPTLLSPTPPSPWYVRYARADAYRVTDPTDYLTHDELAVGQSVWLDPNDVANGIDTVVDAAVDWIRTKTAVDAPTSLPLAALRPNRPNPFSPPTTIRLSLPQETHVTLEIFDVAGRRVRRLVDTWLPAGEHGVTWPGTDDLGHPVASGTYYCKALVGGRWTTRRLVLMR